MCCSETWFSFNWSVYLKDFDTLVLINWTHFKTPVIHSTKILIYLFPLFGHFDFLKFIFCHWKQNCSKCLYTCVFAPKCTSLGKYSTKTWNCWIPQQFFSWNSLHLKFWWMLPDCSPKQVNDTSSIEDYPHPSMLTNPFYYQIFKNCCQSTKVTFILFSHD